MANCDHCEEDAMNVDRFDGDGDDEERVHVMLPSMLVEYESQIEPFLHNKKSFFFKLIVYTQNENKEN